MYTSESSYVESLFLCFLNAIPKGIIVHCAFFTIIQYHSFNLFRASNHVNYFTKCINDNFSVC